MKIRKLFILMILCLSLCIPSLNTEMPRVETAAAESVSERFSPMALNPDYSIEIAGDLYNIVYTGKSGNNFINIEDAGFEIETEGNTIVDFRQTTMPAYRFSHFEIYKNGTYIILNKGMTVDLSFLDAKSEISILGIYVNIFEVFINIPRDYQEMGGYALFVEDAEGNLSKVVNSASNRYIFDLGDIVIVEAIPNPFHVFTEFKQNYKSELMAEEPNKTPTKLKVKVSANREFSLYFDKALYEIKKSVTTSGDIEISAEEIKLGDVIYVSLNLGAMFEVKDFKINGIAVNHENYSGNIVFANNVATIYITEDWLGGLGYGAMLDVEVTTKLNDTFMIVLLCAAVLVPLLILYIIFFLIIGKQQKNAARAYLGAKRVHMQQTDAASFIVGLQEGTLGNITDNEVKKEIKK